MGGSLRAASIRSVCVVPSPKREGVGAGLPIKGAEGRAAASDVERALLGAARPRRW